MEATIQEKKPMRIKGIGDSLWVTLNPDQPLDYLKEELRRLFEPLKQLAYNARIVIDTGGRLDAGGNNAHGDLIRDLGIFLKTNFNVGMVSEPVKERSLAQERLRKKEMDGGLLKSGNDVLMMTGRVRSGQKMTAPKHFLLLGDVNPGGEVIAGGDIIIMGSLRGNAVAGKPDNEDALILALDFRPTQVQIGGYVAAGLPPAKEKIVEFAHVSNGAIVVEDYLRADPFGRLPRPAIR